LNIIESDEKLKPEQPGGAAIGLSCFLLIGYTTLHPENAAANIMKHGDAVN